MKKVKLEAGSGSYEIRVGSGLLPRVGLWLKERGFTDKAVIITDNTVADLYGDTLERGLANAGFNTTIIEVPPGEERKSLETAGRLYGDLTDAFAERNTPVLALGGGVIGDLAGFVAATYMRGLPLVQVPTTLLAQVDSSIGGKTAVDYGRLKNIIGVFYQPRMVVADIDTLATLPPEELANGLAEVIKSAAIRNKNLFHFLDMNINKALEYHPSVLETIVLETARIKADIVERDEKEADLRGILNYGHTIGHAVEAASDYQIKHGQGVAIGMVAAAKIASRMEILDGREVVRLEEIIEKAGLPREMPGIDKDAVLQAMRHDKKVSQNRVRFVLLKTIGNAFISDDVDPSVVEEVLIGWG